VATRYLQALARMDWDGVTACLSSDVLRHGPYGDDYEGVPAYLAFLQEMMPALPGYRLDIDRVTDLDHRRAMVELRETIDVENGRLVTWESLVFDLDAEGRLEEIAIYIRQAPRA
jgi:hypothetical protein